MRAIVKPLPVLYACQGCPQFGHLAREVAALLDATGVVEAVQLETSRHLKPKARFPILTLEACERRCARHWLEQHEVTPDREYVLADPRGSAQRAAQHLAAELGGVQ